MTLTPEFVLTALLWAIQFARGEGGAFPKRVLGPEPQTQRLTGQRSVEQNYPVFLDAGGPLAAPVTLT